MHQQHWQSIPEKHTPLSSLPLVHCREDSLFINKPKSVSINIVICKYKYVMLCGIE
jgi:hypothetical protein